MNRQEYTTEGRALRETALVNHHALISWRSIFAGLFVAFLAYVSAMALGAGIGGATATEIIREEGSGSALATGAVAWMIASTLIALALGSYFAARSSTYITARVGVAHGILIAALYFATMFYGATRTLGFAGETFSSMVGAAAPGVSMLAQNPEVQNAIERNLGDVNLKSEPSVVVQGVASRLIRGQTESARNYLAYQTGQTPAALEARYGALEAEFETALQAAGVKAARAISQTGWALFATLIVGIASAIGGGVLGARANLRAPIVEDQASYNLVTQPV